MKIVLPGFVHMSASAGCRAPEFSFWRWDEMDGYALICPYTIEVDVPGFDATAAMIAFLEKQKRDLQSDFQKRITELTAQIQSLMAIEG
ncbi:MAG: hypothetical protein ACTHJ9_17210 [Rhodanobacter sp.]